VKIRYSNPQKTHPCAKHDYWAQNGDDSSAGATCRRAEENKKGRKEGRKKERHPKQWQTGYSSRPPTSSDQNQTLHGGWPALCSSHVKCDPKRLGGYGVVVGRKWPFPITLASCLYNSLYCRTSREERRRYLQNKRTKDVRGQHFRGQGPRPMIFKAKTRDLRAQGRGQWSLSSSFICSKHN